LNFLAVLKLGRVSWRCRNFACRRHSSRLYRMGDFGFWLSLSL